MKRGQIITQIFLLFGLLVSLYIGLEKYFGEGGCVHGAFFDCAVVRRSAASKLFGIPMWVHGVLWFLVISVLVWLPRQTKVIRVAQIALLVSGWAWVAHLRGVELFVVEKACIFCWGVAVGAIGGGIWPLARAFGNRKGLGFGLTGLLMVVAFFLASLRPSEAPPELVVEPGQDPVMALRESLPMIPGWEWILAGEVGELNPETLLRCGEMPSLVLVYDPQCEDCKDLTQGLLLEEETSLLLGELCLTVTLFEEMVDSPMEPEIGNTTPIILLLDGQGNVVASEAGAIDQDELFGLVGLSMELSL